MTAVRTDARIVYDEFGHEVVRLAYDEPTTDEFSSPLRPSSAGDVIYAAESVFFGAHQIVRLEPGGTRRVVAPTTLPGWALGPFPALLWALIGGCILRLAARGKR